LFMRRHRRQLSTRHCRRLSSTRRHRHRSFVRRRRSCVHRHHHHHRWFMHHRPSRLFVRHPQRPTLRRCVESPDYRRAPSRHNQGVRPALKAHWGHFAWISARCHAVCEWPLFAHLSRLSDGSNRRILLKNPLFWRQHLGFVAMSARQTPGSSAHVAKMGRRERNELRQLSEVLGGGGQQELIFGSTRPTQAQSIQPELGALFAFAENRPHDIADFVNTELHGVLAGGLNGGILSSLEILVLRGAYGASLRQLPFLPYLALRSLLYLGIILLVLLASNLRVGITRADIAFSLAMSLGFNLLLGVNDLLGPGVLFAFVAGRYYHPRREERILLFIDMRASTAIAERLGEERFLDFLNRFITDLSLAIAEAGGEIHKYVGDEITATWTLVAGTNDAACVRACFVALDRLAERGPAYERDFGCRADFRAGLHCGSVVVGELGYLKKEIALIGDSMNTAARIQEACRDTDCRVLASAALIERIGVLPMGVTRRSLGPLPMRGKEQLIALYALETEEEAKAERRGGE
jgi:adenylate cyclase